MHVIPAICGQRSQEGDQETVHVGSASSYGVLLALRNAGYGVDPKTGLLSKSVAARS